MNKLVSVVIPVYKVEDYLDRCVQSIVSQTYENLEIILVDDGSPDSCPEKCDRWMGKDSRIQVIHKQNGGLSDARNCGIQLASGEFICFVDSDDYVFATMIEDMVAEAEKENVKLVLCNLIPVNESGEREYAKEQSPIKDEILTAQEVFPRLYQKLNWYYIVAWNKLYHRDLFETIKFPIGKIHEDEYIISQILWAAGKVACISKEEYIYSYKRQGAITAGKQKERYSFIFEAMYERCLFYRQAGLLKEADLTRKKYFDTIEKVCCEIPEMGGLSKEEWHTVKTQYQKLKKSRMEMVQWILFLLNPRLEYFISRDLRKMIKNGK